MTCHRRPRGLKFHPCARERKPGPYRSRNGLILGVCKGIAGYFDFPLFWARFVAVFFLFFTGFWPVLGLYLMAGLLMKPEPVTPVNSENEQEFYSSLSSSRAMALSRLKRTFDHLDRRLGRLEDVVTGKEFIWEQELYQQPRTPDQGHPPA